MAAVPFASRPGIAMYSETQHLWTRYAMTIWPASFKSSIVMSLRKVFLTSMPKPAPSCQHLVAHSSNSRSCVTPRSRVIAS